MSQVQKDKFQKQQLRAVFVFRLSILVQFQLLELFLIVLCLFMIYSHLKVQLFFKSFRLIFLLVLYLFSKSIEIEMFPFQIIELLIRPKTEDQTFLQFFYIIKRQKFKHSSLYSIITHQSSNINPGTKMEIIFDISMAIAPVTGYVLQYRLINKNQTVGAFSIDICLVLLFANILRVNFYVFEKYQIALFIQSLIMISAQIILLRVCILYRDVPNVQGSQQVLVEGANKKKIHQQFWRWSDFTSYWQFIVGFSTGTFVITIIMKLLDVDLYGQIVGLIALLSQSLLILPQILEIFRKSRVAGISHSLIFLNLVGDIIKIFYFFLKNQPFQFKMCGVIQISLDIFVIAQICYFHNKDLIIQFTGQSQIKDSQMKDIGLKGDKLESNQVVVDPQQQLDNSLSHTIRHNNQQNFDQIQSHESIESNRQQERIDEVS